MEDKINKEIESFITKTTPQQNQQQQLYQLSPLLTNIENQNKTIINLLECNDVDGIKETLKSSIKMSLIGESLLKALKSTMTENDKLKEQNEELEKCKIELVKQKQTNNELKAFHIELKNKIAENKEKVENERKKAAEFELIGEEVSQNRKFMVEKIKVFEKENKELILMVEKYKNEAERYKRKSGNNEVAIKRLSHELTNKNRNYETVSYELARLIKGKKSSLLGNEIKDGVDDTVVKYLKMKKKLKSAKKEMALKLESEKKTVEDANEEIKKCKRMIDMLTGENIKNKKICDELFEKIEQLMEKNNTYQNEMLKVKEKSILYGENNNKNEFNKGIYNYNEQLKNYKMDENNDFLTEYKNKLKQENDKKDDFLKNYKNKFTPYAQMDKKCSFENDEVWRTNNKKESIDADNLYKGFNDYIKDADMLPDYAEEDFCTAHEPEEKGKEEEKRYQNIYENIGKNLFKEDQNKKMDVNYDTIKKENVYDVSKGDNLIYNDRKIDNKFIYENNNDFQQKYNEFECNNEKLQEPDKYGTNNYEEPNYGIKKMLEEKKGSVNNEYTGKYMDGFNKTKDKAHFNSKKFSALGDYVGKEDDIASIKTDSTTTTFKNMMKRTENLKGKFDELEEELKNIKNGDLDKPNNKNIIDIHNDPDFI